MTVEDLIQQQASKNLSAHQTSAPEKPEYVPESVEDNALFKLYHLKGYVNGPGFRVESF